MEAAPVQKARGEYFYMILSFILLHECHVSHLDLQLPTISGDGFHEDTEFDYCVG